ncbi:MAG: hypothetical protein ACYC3Q_00130 [Gemmatimonadaceae bacterium]
MTDTIAPALTPAEWAAIITKHEELVALRAGFGNTPFSSHALAAIFLFEQSFGFTAQDVIDEREVAAYCDAMAAKHDAGGDAGTATAFRDLGGRHRQRAAKIAALLPPIDQSQTAQDEGEPGPRLVTDD